MTATGDSGSATGNVRSLVLRAWIESTGPPRLRARVVEIVQGRGERSVAVATSVDEVCRSVRCWLESLTAEDGGEPGDGAVTPPG